MITIFTDGAARGNPGPGGWGSIIAGDDSVTEVGGRENHTTNNRMELMAAIGALLASHKSEPVILYTDSAYVLNGITRWVKGWQKNKWKTSTKDDVVNRDLWEMLIDASSHREVEWKLLKGHSGIPGNERCDVIATSFADGHPAVLYSGSRSRYGVLLSIPNVSSLPIKKSKDRSKAYSYVAKVSGEIKVFKTWDECKAFVHGASGAKYKKSVSQSDEEEIIGEFKNF